ncbi:MAG TPA: hypothetical protein VHC63_13510 [Acidimicrobiales bacterium]|nr:hypothetical protein [Acidimicrobiales bacterium]
MHAPAHGLGVAGWIAFVVLWLGTVILICQTALAALRLVLKHRGSSRSGSSTRVVVHVDPAAIADPAAVADRVARDLREADRRRVGVAVGQ